MLIIKSSNLPLPKLIYLNVEMFPVLLSAVHSPLPPQRRLSASDLPSGRCISCVVISLWMLCQAPCHAEARFPARFHVDNCCSRGQAATIDGVLGEHVIVKSLPSTWALLWPSWRGKCSDVQGTRVQIPALSFTICRTSDKSLILSESQFPLLQKLGEC